MDDAQRVLLFSALIEPAGPETCWLTPGGGVRGGEALAEAAARELAEETGHVLAAHLLGPVVATCSGQWAAGEQVFLATDSFFFVRVSDPVVDTSRQEPLERSLLTGFRWWTLAELDAAPDQVFPVGLGGLVRQLLATELHRSQCRCRGTGPTADPVRAPGCSAARRRSRRRTTWPTGPGRAARPDPPGQRRHCR